MSARAITKAVETRLRSAAVLNDLTGRVSGVQVSGQPPQNMGQLYYAVWWSGGVSPNDGRIANPADVYHSVTVTITAREGVVPLDRRGATIFTAADLIDLAETLASPDTILGNYAEVMNVANALIVGTAEYSAANGGVPPITTNGFIEPLLLLGYGPVMEKPGTWVGSKDGSDCLVIDVKFGKARRLQI